MHPSIGHILVCGKGCYKTRMDIQFDLDRFVSAQNASYPSALKELHQGHKQGHWMWYIFPQLEGLGHSATAVFYALSGKEEASAYLAHPILGPRLIECTKAALQHAENGANALFGHPDDLKFQSSISLFSRAKPSDPVFQQALDTFFGGVACQPTLKALRIAFQNSLNE